MSEHTHPHGLRCMAEPCDACAAEYAAEVMATCDCGTIDDGHPGDCAIFGRTAPTPADVPGQGEQFAAFMRRLINAWDCCGTCAGGVLAEQIAAAEQRGREDNADHGQCYVSGSKALAERDAEVARAAKAEALKEAQAAVEALDDGTWSNPASWALSAAADAIYDLREEPPA